MNRLTLATAAALVLSACTGSGTATTTTTAASTTPVTANPNPTVEDLAVAIRNGAQLLLDSPAVEARSFEYGEDGVHESTAWAESRSNGNFVMLRISRNRLSGLAVGANAFIAGERFCATSGPSMCDGVGSPTDQPWASFGAADVPSEGYVLNLDIGGWAEGRALGDLDGLPAADIAVAVDAAADGSATWLLTAPLGSAPALHEELITRLWHFAADGLLKGYQIRSESGILFNGKSSAAEWEYKRLESPPPLAVPELDTELDLASLPVPDDLKLPQPSAIDADELIQAVMMGSKQILDAPRFIAVSDTTDAIDHLLRRVWLDYRAGGDYVLVAAVPYEGDDSLVPVSLGATVAVDGQHFEATRQTADSEPWSLRRGSPPDPIPVEPAIEAHARGDVIDPRAESTTFTRQMMDGWVSWAYVEVIGPGTTTQEWRIDADGWLRSHSVLWVGEDTAMQTVTTFTRQEAGDPILAPPIGDPLDPADYGIPDAVLELSE